MDKKPEVLALTETWMTDDHSLVDLDIVGYQPIEFRARPNAKRRSGGVALYVKDGLSFQVVSFKTDIECLIIKITSDNKTSYNICSIYRPETIKINNFIGYLETVLYFLKGLPGETLLFGDFNIDTLKMIWIGRSMWLSWKRMILRYKINYQQGSRPLLRVASIT